MDGEKEKHSTFRELTMNSMRGSKRLMQELRNSILVVHTGPNALLNSHLENKN
jgi:hypothetical protein